MVAKTELPESSFSKILNFIEVSIVSIALSAMTVIVFLQIFFRYVVHASLPWSEELARYVMVWAVFVGASIGARQGVHIGVEAFVKILPLQLQKLCIIFAGLVSVSFCVIATYLAYIVIGFVIDMGQVSPAMEIPMFYAYLGVPVGCSLMAIRFLQATILKLKPIQSQSGD